MKLLLDENIPHKLRSLLMPLHEPFTVSHMGRNGINNGKLLALAAADGFAALLTTDQSLDYQQNVTSLPCSVVILIAKSNKLDDLLPLVPRLLIALTNLAPKTVVRIA